MNSVTYSVVIPVYNGERTVQELAERISRVFEKLNETFEIIFVDDHSQDNSWSVLAGLAKQNGRVVSIKLSANFGQHNAILCGLFYSRGRFAVTMDDDLQHAPEDIPKLIKRMEETGARVVIARLTGKKHEWYRRKASDLFGCLARLTMNKPKGIHLSSFRLIDRQVIEDMLRLESAFPYIPQLIFRVTDEVANIEVEHRERKHGSSNYTLIKMLKLAGRLLINKSSVLMRMVGNTKPYYVIEKTENLKY